MGSVSIHYGKETNKEAETSHIPRIPAGPRRKADYRGPRRLFLHRCPFSGDAQPYSSSAETGTSNTHKGL